MTSNPGLQAVPLPTIPRDGERWSERRSKSEVSVSVEPCLEPGRVKFDVDASRVAMVHRESTSFVHCDKCLSDAANCSHEDVGNDGDDYDGDGGDRLEDLTSSTTRARPSYRRTRSLCGPSPVFNFGPKAMIMKNSATLLTIQDPAHQRLTWYKSPFSVLIIKKVRDESVLEPFCQVASWLIQEQSLAVYVEASVIQEEGLADRKDFQNIKARLCTFKEGEDLHDKIDFIICLGGDGTLLYASSLFQQSVPPVLAFHLGSLGFLTPLVFENDYIKHINNVIEGNSMLTLRSRLKCVIVNHNSPCALEKTIKHMPDTNKCGKTIVVLNEVVVDRGPSPFLSNVDLYIDGRYVTSVQGDGVIISTPTGSTAYAAAAGSSMLHPNVPAIMITPICPHSLSFRPIVVPAGVELKLMVSPDSRQTAWVSFDGRNRQEIGEGDSIRITTSIYPLPSVCSEDTISDWFSSLSECLHWNVRRKQKAHPPPSLNTSPTSSSQSLSHASSSEDLSTVCEVVNGMKV